MNTRQESQTLDQYVRLNLGIGVFSITHPCKDAKMNWQQINKSNSILTCLLQ
jgi:hypothetical protein